MLECGTARLRDQVEQSTLSDWSHHREVRYNVTLSGGSSTRRAKALTSHSSDQHVTRPPSAALALPIWVRAADTFTVLLGLSALQAFFFGGVRIGALSIGDPWRPLIALLIISTVRHYFLRSPPLYQCAGNWLRTAWPRDAVTATWPLVVITRLSVLLVGYLAVVSIGYPEGAPPFRLSDNEAVNLPLRWDTGWYLNIAMEGYQWDVEAEGQQNIAFFPGYPLLTRGVANLLGAQHVMRPPLDRPPRLAMEQFQQIFLGSALLVSLLSFAWGMVWLYRLAREHMNDSASRSALLLMSAYPFAMFFSAAYSESLMFLAVTGAFYHFKRERWVAASFWALMAGITRANGFLLAGPLAVLALRQIRGRRAASVSRNQFVRHALLACLAGAMPVVGVLLFSGFIYSLTGDPFQWREAHTAWGRSFTGASTLMLPIESISERGLIEYTSAQPVEALNAFAAILACSLIWPVIRRLGLEYGLLMTLSVGPPLLFGGFLSMGRVTSLLFPMFMYLALALTDQQRQALVTGFACVQGFAAVLFFTWRVFL